jgi:hypothetical protein
MSSRSQLSKKPPLGSLLHSAVTSGSLGLKGLNGSTMNAGKPYLAVKLAANRVQCSCILEHRTLIEPTHTIWIVQLMPVSNHETGGM